MLPCRPSLRTYLRRIVRKRRRIGWLQQGSCQVQGLQLVRLVLQLVVQVLLLQKQQWVGMLAGRLGTAMCLWLMSLRWMRRVGMGRLGRRLGAMLWSSRGLE
jgi:hypothetical protein